MSRKIYKYIGPSILKRATDRDGFIGLKCSYPKDYNDPYELFLSIDVNLEPQLLAYYNDSIGLIPQFPTTCFSNSPVIVPMWAHYGHSSRGFVIEIDEEKLSEKFEDISIGDVKYADSANKEIASFLTNAFGTKKPRHTFFLQKAVMASAYFTKQSCWSYEQERRVLVPQYIIEENDGNMIFFVPADCVTAIIAGAKIDNEYWQIAQQISHSIECELFRGYIGNSYPDMFFRGGNNEIFVFSGERIDRADAVCNVCSEPLTYGSDSIETCNWCSITEAHNEYAAMSNPYRALQQAGILEEHLKSMESIWHKK